MQMVKKLLLVLVLLPFLVLFLAPKKELYYLLEKKLFTDNIVISGEALRESLFGLTIEHPTVYLGGAAVASAKEISLWSLLFYTRMDTSDLRITEDLPTAMHIERLKAVHSLLSPLRVKLAGESSLGALEGEIRLKARRLHLNIAEGGNSQALVRYLKKSEKGWVYESKF